MGQPATQFGELLTSDEIGTCCNCGVRFASSVVAQRRKDGLTFYCPNGHPLTYGKSQLDRANEELARVQKSLEWERSQRETADLRRGEAIRSARAHKAHATRSRNKLARVHAGVCPECNRTFKQLAAHMHTKHPGVSK